MISQKSKAFRERFRFRLTVAAKTWLLIPYIFFVLLSLFRRVVFWELRCDRIAHFVIDFCEQKVELTNSNSQFNFHYLGQKRVSNDYWLERVKEEFLFLPFIRQMKFIDDVARNLKYLRPMTKRISWRPSSLYSSRFLEHQELRFKHEPILFSPEEDEIGLSWLATHGIGRNEKIITVLLRDSQYLLEEFSDVDFSYHDYRDVDTDNYALAISKLVDLGYVVIRLGKKQSKRIPFKHSRFIDYAFCESRTDFLDLWLVARSTGMMSTGTGQDQIAITNNIPIFFVDLTPLSGISQYANCLVAPKRLVSAKSGKYLELEEQVSTTYYSTFELLEKGLLLKNLTSDELFKCSIEFHQFINDDFSSCTRYRELISQFVESKAIRFFHERCSISKSWLGNSGYA